MQRQRFIWWEEYRCGCVKTFEYKKQMPGYCEDHGENWINRFKWDLGETELFYVEPNPKKEER